MIADRRIYRTGEGPGADRLVYEGDPDAAFLAYSVGDTLSPADAERLPAPPADATKRRTPTEDKSRGPAADK